MKRTDFLVFGVATIFVALAGQIACSAAGGKNDCTVFGDCAGGGGAGGWSNNTGGSGQTTSGQGGDGGCLFGNCNPSGGNPGSTGSGAANCNTDPTVDDDKDGASENQGDCNDCDPNVGPGAIEVLTDPNDPMAQPSDEDCDGKVDNVATYCDQNLVLQDADPNNGARAVDLCQFVNPGELKWGVMNAKYVRANGSTAVADLDVGLLPNFGPNVNPQGGARVLSISSGYSRLAGDANACGFSSCSVRGGGTPPPGFPQDPPGCPVSPNINDDIGLEVDLRAPTNATGYKFNFKFYSFEYPEWVCQTYNDQFISLVSPPPMGSINGNISFDSANNPVSVNVAFFDVCTGCPAGTSQMDGTGFNVWNDAGGTSWLQSTAPVKGGDVIKIRWAIWDTGDTAYDSTAIVDNFQWIANGGTVVVGTTPVPTPK